MEYLCTANLNIYDSPECHSLATQAAKGRYLEIIEPTGNSNSSDRSAVMVRLVEDDYPGWLLKSDLDKLEPALTPYQFPILSVEEIKNRLPEAIAFTYQAMNTPNYYLWGGTVGPNYDCSGLMQAAFASVGIWIPRDAYQQEAFTEAINTEAINTEAINLDKRENMLYLLEPGDLIFFGPPEKATHVGLYLGEGRYLHSSGKKDGRNGIGIDVLSESGDEVSQHYYRQLRGAGRVVTSYQPTGPSQ
jgi:cell wall-associated NlpC family hydrolase